MTLSLFPMILKWKALNSILMTEMNWTTWFFVLRSGKARENIRVIGRSGCCNYAISLWKLVGMPGCCRKWRIRSRLYWVSGFSERERRCTSLWL